jgi:hypothetical protein
MLRVRINWTGLCEGFSVMHFDDVLANAQSTADAVSEWLDDTNVVRSVAQFAQVDSEVLLVNVGTGAIEGATQVVTAIEGGNLGTDPLPQASMILARWRTGVYLGGREIRGRTFIPGLGSENLGTNGELDPTQLQSVVLSGTALINASALAVWSPTNGSLATVATSAVWPEFAVMRSRRE